jgi:microcystin-dependent protein
MPTHTHAANASNNDASDSAPQGNYPAAIPAGGYAASANAQMNAGLVGSTGGSQPHTNIQPYLTLNLCIALEGIFPSRN